LKPAGEITAVTLADGSALTADRSRISPDFAAKHRPMHITLVLNRNAGTLRGYDPEQIAEELAGIFREQGHTVAPEVYAGHAAVAAIARICRTGGCDAIVVGGGDGTISAAAAAAAEGRLPLGIIPLGTMNLFARALGIPLEMRAAAQALACGSVSAVDIGEVNGRFFIHHVTLGLHPRMIRIRERLHYGSRIGKIFASAHAFWIVVRQPPRLNVALKVNSKLLHRRTAAVLVSNNPLGEGHLPYADDLRQGKLGLYAATSRRWGDLLQLTAQVTLGQIAENPLLETWQAERIEISLHRPIVSAAIDGEIVSLRSPLRLTVRERGLLVLRPAYSG
jgi:diacylglycerol kinase family enzyme